MCFGRVKCWCNLTSKLIVTVNHSLIWFNSKFVESLSQKAITAYFWIEHISLDQILFVGNFFGTKPGHHAVTSFTKPGPAILT